MQGQIGTCFCPCTYFAQNGFAFALLPLLPSCSTSRMMDEVEAIHPPSSLCRGVAASFVVAAVVFVADVVIFEASFFVAAFVAVHHLVAPPSGAAFVSLLNRPWPLLWWLLL